MKATIELKDEDGVPYDVTIDLAANSFANAQKLFAARTKLIDKEKKTRAGTEEALKKAKQSAMSEIKNKIIQSKKKRFIAERRAKWYEKFYWFLSSENFLVISARDAQQNEILLKRYLSKQDVVFHAQIQGAAFTVVKNTNPDEPVPSLTLLEAATASLAHSRAWETKVVVPVYWVYTHQVSKSAPTGMSLPSGSFMIYGKKNFVYPYKLEMGFGLLFKVDEESAKKHEGERKVKPEEPRIEMSYTELPKEESKFDEYLKKNKQDIDAEEVKLLDVKRGAPKKQQQKPQQKQNDKSKNASKNAEVKEEVKEEPAQKGGKKTTKKKQEKINKYMERFGDEPKEEQALRLKMQGYQKNYAFESKKKEFEWNQGEENEEAFLIDTNVEPIKEELEQKEKEEIKKDKPEKRPPKVKEAEEIVIQEDEELELETYADLTGAPFKEDSIYEVMTVCAPYSTLQGYRYKVKLVPGVMKRGKILQMALEIFKSIKEDNPKEKELIKYIPEKDAVLQLLSYCKVQAPGMAKVTRNMGKKKKDGKGGKKK